MAPSQLTTLVACLALMACGEKPKPKPTPPPPTAAPVEGDAAGPAEPEPAPRTRGGVDLTAALEGAGEAKERVLAAAQQLAKKRDEGVRALVAEKAAAKATVLALLGSANFDELIGAMEVIGADGDPAGARADGTDGVLALLAHDSVPVRDVAWETAAKIADGAALAKLLPTLARDKKLAVIRLLAAWDGAPVRDALWALAGGDDAELALEAALAASAPGKDLTPVEPRLQALVKDPREGTLRLALIMYRRFVRDPKAKVSDAWKDAIDRALVAKDEPLALEGVRGVQALPLEERRPLFEQLGADPRTAVRAVVAELLAEEVFVEAEGMLDKLLKDAEGDVRMAAASARSRYGTPEARFAALSPLLSDPNRGVRLAAAVSLARADLVALSLESLTKQLEREDEEGQKAIVGAIAAGDNRVGLNAVIALLGDKKRGPIAFYALTAGTGKDFGDDVGKWRAWVDATYPPPPPPPPAPNP